MVVEVVVVCVDVVVVVVVVVEQVSQSTGHDATSSGCCAQTAAATSGGQNPPRKGPLYRLHVGASRHRSGLDTGGGPGVVVDVVDVVVDEVSLNIFR